MVIDKVMLNVSDGTVMHAYAARPDGDGPRPAIIVFQEAFGVNRHIRKLVESFTRQGFVAIAPELFHRSAPPGFEGSYTDFPAIMPHLQALTTAGMEADIQAAWEWVELQPGVRKGSVVCIGYCLGGRVAWIANSLLPFKAAISYYGGRIAPELLLRAPALHGPMLFFWGGLDQHIPPEQIAAVVESMRQAGKPFVNVVFSDANHGFFCDERLSFNRAACKESWALTLAFLREKLA